MCGIVGVWRPGGRPVEAGEIEAMLRRVDHRGPDDRGTWAEAGCAFGHVRLSVLDLTERARQPLVTPDGDGVLVYNGEVYNFAELRAELESEGAVFRSTGDTEVVLEALHRWGPESAVERFNGMFAFAYLDRRARELWLGRDRFGIKPLYVARAGEAVLLASEVKALLAHPDVPCRPSWPALQEVLLKTRITGTRTAFEGIEAVPSGGLWCISSDGIRRRRYFALPDSVDVHRIANAAGGGPRGAADTFERELQRSVRLHLRSDAPLATLCSGGVDSSLVTAYARDVVPDLVAYVADIDDPEGEGRQARRVARHLGVEMHTVPFGPEEHLRTWPRAVWLFDAPTYHPSDTALLAVTRECRRAGIKVLLTGEGSDELFGGYPWQRLTFFLWRRIRSLHWRLRNRRHRRRREAARLDLSPLSTDLARTDPVMRVRLMTALGAETELTGRRLMRALAALDPESERAFKAQCLADVDRHLHTILQRHDRMGMGASVEMRVPFLENGMIDLGLHAPVRWLYHRGRSKWVVKRAAERHLPRAVVHARKKGFPVPIRFSRGAEALLRDGALAELLGWDRGVVEDLIALAPHAPDALFRWSALELWARIFLRREDPDELGERLVAAGRAARS